MREQILAMKPGRELDALVAEKVMGYVVSKARAGLFDDGGVHIIKGTYYYPFRPSTKISYAWEVVEKLPQKIQCHTEIGTVWPKPDSPMEYTVLVWTRSFSREYRVTAKTAPEAICKAALLACLEVE